MNQLFSDSETFQKDRPTKLSAIQEEAFYKEMADEVRMNNWSSDTTEEIAYDLKELHPFYGNGYEKAKRLEKAYNNKACYDIDPSFCEWLEDLEYQWNSKVEENVKAWVKAHNPQPKYKVGDAVILHERLIHKLPIGQTVFITGIKLDTANYTIWETADHQGGYVITYERLEAAVQPIPESTKPNQP